MIKNSAISREGASLEKSFGDESRRFFLRYISHQLYYDGEGDCIRWREEKTKHNEKQKEAEKSET